MGVHKLAKSRYKTVKSDLAEIFHSKFLPRFRQFENEIGTWSSSYPVSLKDRVWLLKNGFLTPSGVQYDLSDSTKDQYLSFRDRIKTGDINSPWCEILNNKLIFHRELSEIKAPLPTLYAVIHNGQIGGVDVNISRQTDPGEWVLQKLRVEGQLVLKPVKGSTGTGIHFFESIAHDDAVMLNGEQVSIGEAKVFVRSLEDYLITAHISQSDWLHDIYPHSLNTMRILTMWDDENEEMFIASAILRIGTEQSRPVDNFSKGGLSAAIDIETGQLSPAAKLDSGEINYYSTHPNTGADIAGRTIKEWPKVRKSILDTAEAVLLPEYVGWDVTIDSNGDPIIIEGNNSSDVDLLQIHEPLLNTDRVRKFYKRHGVI